MRRVLLSLNLSISDGSDVDVLNNVFGFAQAHICEDYRIERIPYLAPRVKPPERGFPITRSSLTRFYFDNNNADLIWPSNYILHLTVTATSDLEGSSFSLLFDKNRANVLIHLQKIFSNYIVGLDDKRLARLQDQQVSWPRLKVLYRTISSTFFISSSSFPTMSSTRVGWLPVIAFVFRSRIGTSRAVVS